MQEQNTEPRHEARYCLLAGRTVAECLSPECACDAIERLADEERLAQAGE